MTQYRFDAVKGAHKTDVVVTGGTTIGSNAVRVIIDDANVDNKDDVLKAMDACRQKLIEAKWPLV